MYEKLVLDVDVKACKITWNDKTTVKIKKCRGLFILALLCENLDKPFTPSLVRINIENNRDVQIMQQDEYSYLLNQACQYIPATDRQTIKEIIQEIHRNELEIIEAREINDDSIVEYLLNKNQMLYDYLSNSVNINHTIKNINQTKINDYRSISRSLEVLIKLIKKQAPQLERIISEHLIVNSQQICLLA